MADKQRGGGTEPLTEREREALRELARQIVREAGLVPDPAAEAAKAEAEAEEKRREDIVEEAVRNLQQRIEFFKHMTTLSGATIVGALAVYGAFLKGVDPSWLFYVSLGLIASAMVISGLRFGGISGYVDYSPARGDHWRDRELENLVMHRVHLVQLNNRYVRVVTYLWYGGFFGLVASLLLNNFFGPTI